MDNPTEMTLRDYFAAHVIASLVAHRKSEGGTLESFADKMAHDAWMIADAMVRHRSEPPGMPSSRAGRPAGPVR